jgi:NAD(P)H dehydrogenase (quinone)
MADFSGAVLGVTGASGYVGRAVVHNLKQRGAKRIVAISRDPGTLADLDGVEVRAGDFYKPETLGTAFAGIDRLLMISAAVVGERLPHQIAAVDAAERAGVSHILYTSLTSPYPHPTHAVQNDHFWTEQRLFQTAGGWTSLRDNLYADYVVWQAQQTLETGKLFHAAGDGRRALVFRDDVAATAAGALLTAEGREIVDVSGPEALSYAEIAALLSKVGGRPVEAVEVSHEAQLDGMMKGGLPPPVAEAFAGFDVAVKRGALAITSDAVERFAGRPPQHLEAALRAALARQS